MPPPVQCMDLGAGFFCGARPFDRLLVASPTDDGAPCRPFCPAPAQSNARTPCPSPLRSQTPRHPPPCPGRCCLLCSVAQLVDITYPIVSIDEVTISAVCTVRCISHSTACSLRTREASGTWQAAGRSSPAPERLPPRSLYSCAGGAPPPDPRCLPTTGPQSPHPCSCVCPVVAGEAGRV